MDGEAIVHQPLFMDRKSKNYDTLHISFGRYTDAASWKKDTSQRRKRSIKDDREYVCVDLKHVRTTLEVFLNHTKTNTSLTAYETTILFNCYKHGPKRLVVSTVKGTMFNGMSVD